MSITEEKFRYIVKQAFMDGFAAARLGSAAGAWELAQMRLELDHHGLYERVSREPRSVDAVDPVGGDGQEGPRA